jgi:hypothetical protein
MYDITEIGEMLELYGQPLLAYKAKEEGRGGDGGHFGERHDGETSGPLNVDAAIENMVPGNINNIRTQAAAALITRGQLIEDASWDIISKMKEALGTEAAGWDWSKENADLEWSCYRLVNKKLREQGEDLGHTLPDDLYLRWNEVLGRGERPQICQNRTGSGYHIRTYSFDHKQKEGSDMERPQLKVVAGEDTEQEPPREEIHRSRIPILLSSAQFTDGFTPPDYLVDGVLQRRFLYTLTAKTGDGKTATAMYLAYAVGEGEPIGGHEVEPGHVCMLAGENPDDVRMRWMAMSEHLGFDIKNIKVHFIAGKYDIRKIRLVIDAKAKELGIDFALVIVDTSAAYFPGNEENSNSQLGDHARVLRTLVDIKGGPTVLVTCHPVKNADPENLLPRGGGRSSRRWTATWWA